MKKQFKKLKDLVIRPVPLSVGLFLFTASLLLYKLLTLVPFGQREQAQEIGAASLSQIKTEVLFAPMKGLQFAIIKFGDNDAWLRFASVAVGLVAAYFLYLMLRKWYTPRVSLLTTLMFVSSSWFLHVSRLASQDVMYLSVVPGLILICLWFLSKKNDLKLPLAAILLGLLLYVPGAAILLLAALVLFRKYLVKTIPKLPLKFKLLGSLAFLVTLAPLFYSFAFRQRQIIEWLGFNEHQSFDASSIAANLIEIPRQLFVSGPSDAAVWLVGTPVLDIFSVVMLGLGIYAYRAGYYPARERLVFSLLAVTFVIIWLGNVATISLMLPLLYVFIANGIAYMLQSWFTVFPRNPLARSIGIATVTVVVLISCSYHIQRYFVAWPQAEHTKRTLLISQ